MAGNSLWEDNSYPRDNGRYAGHKEHTLQPSDHFKGATPNGYLGGDDLYNPPPPPRRFNDITRQLDDNSYIVKNKAEHFIRDLNDTNHSDAKAESRPVVVENSNVVMQSILNGAGEKNPSKVVFSGATTNINPTNDPEKHQIIHYGLSDVEENRVKVAGDFRPPLSVMHPFTRMIDIKNPNDHQLANISAFNRYHLPQADLEHRKAFRHVFFTRPECYVCTADGGKVRLCQQAEYDEDFNTSYSRMPYIIKMLAPVYVSRTFGMSNIPDDNFNYLLTNRCMGLSPTGSTLSTQDTVGKSIQGYTITPGMHYEGRQGSTISVTFRDTKYLEVYEFIRMWMLYIWKIKYGVFAPSFNGYHYTNGFPDTSNGDLKVSEAPHLHPFDRALDYTISMFDFVMDESDSFPRYWCKYFGMFPIDLQIEGLSNSKNDALKEELTINVTFKYAYKIENTMKTLVEFNYNAGIVNNLGQPTAAGSDMLTFSNQFAYADNIESKLLKYYVGPGAGFVGTPYVVLMNVNKDIMKDTDSGSTMTPCLRFSPLLNDTSFNQRINMGIESIDVNTNLPAQSDLSSVKVAAEATQAKVEAAEKEAGEMSLSEVMSFGAKEATKELEKVDNLVDDVLEHPGKYVLMTANANLKTFNKIFGTNIDIDLSPGAGKKYYEKLNHIVNDQVPDAVDDFLQSAIDANELGWK